MSFRLLPKLVTLNDLERRNTDVLLYFTKIVYDAGVKQLHQFRHLVLIVYDHIKTICAIIQRLFWQNKLITRFDGRKCIDD